MEKLWSWLTQWRKKLPKHRQSLKHTMSGEYIFLFEADLDHYEADVYAVRCVDNRFWKTFKRFIKFLNLGDIDPKSPAGGIKDFASPEKESDRDYVLRQLGISMDAHRVNKVMLFSHHDCAAYGGGVRFKDAKEEFAFHVDEHRKARGVISSRFPAVAIDSYFIDAKGVRKI